MTGVHHIVHVLVGRRRLLHHQLRRGHPDGDALLLELLEHIGVVQVAATLRSAQGPAGTVTGGAKRLLHALLGTGQHPAIGTHRAADQHRLSGDLVVHRYQRVVWWKRTSGAFTMNQQLSRSAVHHVLLDFGHVVADVVDHLHVQIVRCGLEHLRERLPGQEGHRAAIHPGEIGG